MSYGFAPAFEPSPFVQLRPGPSSSRSSPCSHVARCAWHWARAHCSSRTWQPVRSRARYGSGVEVRAQGCTSMGSTGLMNQVC